MTPLLQQAFDEATKLTEAEQDLLATWLLAELAAENEFERTIAGTTDKLVELARSALADYRAGQTEEP